jgi:hypothetical protein
MMLFITVAGSLVEPESDVVLVYKIHGPSGNRTLAVQRCRPIISSQHDAGLLLVAARKRFVASRQA